MTKRLNEYEKELDASLRGGEIYILCSQNKGKVITGICLPQEGELFEGDAIALFGFKKEIEKDTDLMRRFAQIGAEYLGIHFIPEKNN